jgi:hypothetical protein
VRRYKILVVCVLSTSPLYAVANELVKTALRRSDSKQTIEKANLILHFTQLPLVQIDEKNGEKKTLRFIFDDITKFSSAIAKAVNEINALKPAFYSIHIALNDRRQLVVTCSFDPEKIVITHEPIDSIGLQKGFQIKVLNKEFIKSLEKAEKPVFFTAFNGIRRYDTGDCKRAFEHY